MKSLLFGLVVTTTIVIAAPASAQVWVDAGPFGRGRSRHA